MLSISCVEKEEDTIWTELLVVTASHYEAVRCARLKKAAMIIMIQSVRSRGEWVSPKKQQCARCWNLFTTNTCLTPRHGCDEQDHKRWIYSTVTVKFPGYQESFQAIRKVFRLSGKFPGYQESFQTIRKNSRLSGKFSGYQESFQTIRKNFRLSGKFSDYQENFQAIRKVFRLS